MTQRAHLYRGHRYSAAVIAQAVWLYFRFPLSLRMVEELPAERGIVVSHETIRRWVLKFGAIFAAQFRKRPTAVGNKWHLDEMVIAINGEKHWLWRAVDQYGVVLDVLDQRRRDARAAARLMRKRRRRQGHAPRVMITDKLRSYGAAAKKLMLGAEHRQHSGLNNRAENSRQPTRQRERGMKRFKSRAQAQRFLSIHGRVANHFRTPADTSASHRRELRTAAVAAWMELT